jgi:hypothetical protein
VYYLAFMFCNEPEDIKKVSKSLLKQNPQRLRLYNAYAMIEWSRNNPDISENVLTSALSMSKSLPENEQKDAILLWKSWAMIALEAGNNAEALLRLLTIAECDPSQKQNINGSSPAALLKTKQHLTSQRDHLLSSGNLSHAITHLECLALLSYLTSHSNSEATSQSQGDIGAALAIFNASSETLIARGLGATLAHELLLQSAARLLYHHTRRGPFRPALLRTHLANSLALFPRSTIFLSLYAWNESRLRIDDRVRSVLRDVVLSEANDNLISRLFAVRFEMRNGNVHSTRAAFENAVVSPACSSNPGLWRFYVLWCLGLDFKEGDAKEEGRRRAKEVFYRGMRKCPWSKELLMVPFVEREMGMGREELVAVYRVMGEKELRIHVDMDERVEGWRQSGTG